MSSERIDVSQRRTGKLTEVTRSASCSWSAATPKRRLERRIHAFSLQRMTPDLRRNSLMEAQDLPHRGIDGRPVSLTFTHAITTRRIKTATNTSHGRPAKQNCVSLLPAMRGPRSSAGARRPDPPRALPARSVASGTGTMLPEATWAGSFPPSTRMRPFVGGMSRNQYGVAPAPFRRPTRRSERARRVRAELFLDLRGLALDRFARDNGRHRALARAAMQLPENGQRPAHAPRGTDEETP